MPQSHLVPNLRYGGSGYSVAHFPSGRSVSASDTSRDAVFSYDPIEERFYADSSGGILFKTLLISLRYRSFSTPFIDHGPL